MCAAVDPVRETDKLFSNVRRADKSRDKSGQSSIIISNKYANEAQLSLLGDGSPFSLFVALGIHGDDGDKRTTEAEEQRSREGKRKAGGPERMYVSLCALRIPSYDMRNACPSVAGGPSPDYFPVCPSARIIPTKYLTQSLVFQKPRNNIY